VNVRLNLLGLALAGLLAWAPGCQSNAANVVKMAAEGGNADIQVTNEPLQDDLELVPERIAYEGDILVAWVKVRNHVDDKMGFEYRWRFYDADGKEIDVGGTSLQWNTKWANPLEEVQVDGHASKPGAVRTEFHLRYASE
jgi:hypothetical protein